VGADIPLVRAEGIQRIPGVLAGLFQYGVLKLLQGLVIPGSHIDAHNASGDLADGPQLRLIAPAILVWRNAPAPSNILTM